LFNKGIIMATQNVINTGMPIEATHGATGVGSPTAHKLPVAEGSSAFNFLGPLNSGELLIGSTGNDPVAASLSAGTGISITPGAGSISIAATGGTGMTWQVISADQSAVATNGYICNKGTTLALALPATSAAGDVIAVTGMNNATGWQITQPNAGSQIFFGNMSTTLGVGGSLTSTGTRDSLTLVCCTANATWNVLNGVGNITVV
jgi:hypothetical protein